MFCILLHGYHLQGLGCSIASDRLYPLLAMNLALPTAMNIVKDPKIGFCNSSHAGANPARPRLGLTSFITPQKLYMHRPQILKCLIEFDNTGMCGTSGRLDDDPKRRGDGDEAAPATMLERSAGRRTVPRLFIDGDNIGGMDGMQAPAKAGELDPGPGIKTA